MPVTDAGVTAAGVTATGAVAACTFATTGAIATTTGLATATCGVNPRAIAVALSTTFVIGKDFAD